MVETIEVEVKDGERFQNTHFRAVTTAFMEEANVFFVFNGIKHEITVKEAREKLAFVKIKQEILDLEADKKKLMGQIKEIEIKIERKKKYIGKNK